MKIAYVSSPYFADCDIPLIQCLQEIVSVTYILCVNDKSKGMTHIHINKLKDKGNIYPSSFFPELSYLSAYVDLEKTFIQNMPAAYDLSPENIKAVYKTVRFLQHGEFDIIHVTWPPRYGSFLLYALRKKMVMTMHDPLPHSNDDTWLNRFHRITCFKLVDNFILLNESQKESFIKTYGMERKNVFMSRLSIFTCLRDITPQDTGEKGYVLFFGSISPHKGVEYLCEAMRIVHEKIKNSKLIVAGRGNIYFNIKPYTDRGYVELRNYYISDNEMVGLMRNAAFVVCPYVDATQSGVIMSAFALDKPVVATNVGALPEMMKDGRHGIIVEPKDSRALADAMKNLLAHPETIRQMSRNINSDFSDGEMSWKKIAGGMRDIYKKILYGRK